MWTVSGSAHSNENIRTQEGGPRFNPPKNPKPTGLGQI